VKGDSWDVADQKKAMANNTALIVNSLINNTPITGTQTVAGIPTIYSKITVITKDDL